MDGGNAQRIASFGACNQSDRWASNCPLTAVSDLFKSLKTAHAIALSAIACAANLSGASLKPETVNAWDEYVRNARIRIEQRLRGDNPFLWIDGSPEKSAKVLRRQIVVAPMGPQVPEKVPDGLVHDWIGAAFIPNANINDVLSVIRDYSRYSEFYSPSVIEAKALATSKTVDRFSMVLMNKALFSRIALEGNYQTSYVRINDRRLYSVSFTTRMREIAEYGSPQQHLMPDNEGTGLIWRAFNVTRFEERNGGVYVETEVIALSRDIPSGLRWFVEPIVRHTSRDALTTALRQTRDVVQCVLAARSAPQTPRPALTNVSLTPDHSNQR
jgi:hypothetical protein